MSQSWRIHEIAHDFRLEDVWAVPTPGGPGDFPRLVDLAASLDPAGLRDAPPAPEFALPFIPMLREFGRAWRERPGERASVDA